MSSVRRDLARKVKSEASGMTCKISWFKIFEELEEKRLRLSSASVIQIIRRPTIKQTNDGFCKMRKILKSVFIFYLVSTSQANMLRQR